MRLLTPLACLLVLAACDKSDAPPDGNGERALLTWSRVEAGYVGSFDVPMGEDGDYRFGYSSAIHAQLANGNLLVEGHPSYDRLAEIALPAALDGSDATRVGAWDDITDGLLPAGWEGGEAYVLGGLLEIGSRVYFTKHQWYNASGDDWDSQGYAESGSAHGMWNVEAEGATSQRVGGYMSYAPESLRDEGYTYLAGQQGTSGAASGRWGPNLFAIDFRGAGSSPSSPLPARALMYHDGEEHSAEGWWVGDRVTAVQWIETPTHHGVLVFLYQSVGAEWYGETFEGPGGLTSVYDGAKGYHAAGYELSVWIYDPADLLAVFRGEREPWSLEPVEKTVLVSRHHGTSTETARSFVSGSAIARVQVSYRDGRLIILVPEANTIGLERTPRGYVVEL